MTDDSRILDALRAIIEVVDKARSELPDEPGDPLDEVVSGYAPSTSPNHDAEADAWLEQSGKPRTLRNLLTAYVQARPSTNFVSASSPSTRKWYRILRVRSSRAKHPENDVFSTPIEFTESFPLPLHPPAERLVGWTFDEKYKVLDYCEIEGNTYLIAVVL